MDEIHTLIDKEYLEQRLRKKLLDKLHEDEARRIVVAGTQGVVANHKYQRDIAFSENFSALYGTSARTIVISTPRGVGKSFYYERFKDALANGKVLCVDCEARDRFNEFVYDDYFTTVQIDEPDPKVPKYVQMFGKKKKGGRSKW